MAVKGTAVAKYSQRKEELSSRFWKKVILKKDCEAQGKSAF
jgi:hypothetical protein